MWASVPCRRRLPPQVAGRRAAPHARAPPPHPLPCLLLHRTPPPLAAACPGPQPSRGGGDPPPCGPCAWPPLSLPPPPLAQATSECAQHPGRPQRACGCGDAPAQPPRPLPTHVFVRILLGARHILGTPARHGAPLLVVEGDSLLGARLTPCARSCGGGVGGRLLLAREQAVLQNKTGGTSARAHVQRAKLGMLAAAPTTPPSPPPLSRSLCQCRREVAQPARYWGSAFAATQSTPLRDGEHRGTLGPRRTSRQHGGSPPSPGRQVDRPQRTAC